MTRALVVNIVAEASGKVNVLVDVVGPVKAVKPFPVPPLAAPKIPVISLEPPAKFTAEVESTPLPFVCTTPAVFKPLKVMAPLAVISLMFCNAPPFVSLIVPLVSNAPSDKSKFATWLAVEFRILTVRVPAPVKSNAVLPPENVRVGVVPENVIGEAFESVSETPVEAPRAVTLASVSASVPVTVMVPRELLIVFIPPPATVIAPVKEFAEVTPALASATDPPKLTLPPPDSPLPAVTVIEEFVRAEFGISESVLLLPEIALFVNVCV